MPFKIKLYFCSVSLMQNNGFSMIKWFSILFFPLLTFGQRFRLKVEIKRQQDKIFLAIIIIYTSEIPYCWMKRARIVLPHWRCRRDCIRYIWIRTTISIFCLRKPVFPSDETFKAENLEVEGSDEMASSENVRS